MGAGDNTGCDRDAGNNDRAGPQNNPFAKLHVARHLTPRVTSDVVANDVVVTDGRIEDKYVVTEGGVRRELGMGNDEATMPKATIRTHQRAWMDDGRSRLQTGRKRFLHHGLLGRWLGHTDDKLFEAAIGTTAAGRRKIPIFHHRDEFAGKVHRRCRADIIDKDDIDAWIRILHEPIHLTRAAAGAEDDQGLQHHSYSSFDLEPLAPIPKRRITRWWLEAGRVITYSPRHVESCLIYDRSDANEPDILRVGEDYGEYPVEFSAVISCYFEEVTIREFHRRLRAALQATGHSFEIVYVNDGSTDGTLAALLEIYEADTAVGIVIDLMKNSGSAAAVAAGCVEARGRHFIFLDSDLQLEPEDLPRLMQEFDKGADLVNGLRRTRNDTWMRTTASRLLQPGLRWLSGAQLADLFCTFKVVHGQLVRGLGPGPRRVLNPVHLAAAARDWADVLVEHHPRPHGSSNWTVAGLLGLILDTLFGLPRNPFRLIGEAAVLSSVLLALYVAFGSLAGEAAKALTPPVLALGLSVVIVVLWLIGEYLLQLHRSLYGAPRYMVRALWRRTLG